MRFNRAFTLYHGSPDASWVERLRTGTAMLKPRKAAGRSRMSDPWLQPLPGRVYLTSHVSEAFRYAQDARWTSPWDGVVLVVEVPPGADVLPDEDCVGVAAAYAFGHEVRELCGGDEFGGAVHEDAELLELLRESALAHLTPARIRRFADGTAEPRDFAAAGKKMLPRLSDEVLLRLIAHGANLAVVPPVEIRGGWLLTDKTPDAYEEYGEPDPAIGGRRWRRRISAEQRVRTYGEWVPMH